MKNYGIFKATEEICTNNVERDRLMTREDLWSVVDNDCEIGAPIEAFDTFKEARAALQKYTSGESINRYNNRYYLDYTVYFIADIVHYIADIEDGYNGDGYDIAPLRTMWYIVYEAGTCKEIFRSRSRKEAEDFIEEAEADDSDSCLDMREERE